MGLEIKNLNKSFGGHKVVDNVSFSMKSPCALGLVGLNGAGKTTTIRMIIDILKKDSGEVLWNGEKLDRNKVKIGYLPEERGIYRKVTVREQLLYFAILKGMTKEEANASLNSWATLMNVTEYLDKNADELSKGNQQKIQLLTSLMHDPDLIILDEPLSGLDPVNAELIKDILANLIKKGKYIIFTSHQMNVVEEFCTELIMLADGKVVIQGNISGIKKKYEKNILCIKGEKELIDYIKFNYEAKINEEGEAEIILDDTMQMNNIMKDILAKKLMFTKFEIKTPSLREIFIEKAGEINETV